MVKCRMCDFENEDGASVCELCGEPLNGAIEEIMEEKIGASVQEIMDNTSNVTEKKPEDESSYEFFVMCPESSTRTIVEGDNIKSFYCDGCKMTHDIDGFLWKIEKKSNQPEESNVTAKEKEMPSPQRGTTLWLEEMNTHERIDIDEPGGTLGRYGQYGADFFQNRNLLTVSGEHCAFSFNKDSNDWAITHLSNTNETKYDNMILEKGTQRLIEDGKVLTLARSVSFLVRIQ